ncbi:MAG: acetate--CoA ligase family protein [Deltaproteobacteria bacterium]|nr:acetate--CoA ligase family protein [Deltaproteobacteria bacterium]
MARLLEHHALEILQNGGIPIPAFRVVSTPEKAVEAAKDLNCPIVLKALIPAGGRGKAGAIRRARSSEEALTHARELLGTTVLHFPVEELLVSEAVEIEKEFFVSITFDSMSRRPVVLFSSLGGIDVEAILAENPERLIQRSVDISLGLQPFLARGIAESAGLRGDLLVETANLLATLYGIFRRYDAQTIEINPLVLTPRKNLVAPSAVIVIDNQAIFRHPELEQIADPDRTNGWRPLTPLEKKMRAIDRTDLSSAIRFNEFESGEIAFMVTGGGAGLLALDTITKIGGGPATTFDITPGRVEEKMYLATRAILSKPGLKGLIAGGNITNFIPIDVKVRGVMRALKELKVQPKQFPVVFRFAGPGVEIAKELAAELPGIVFFDASVPIEEAVRKIVELTKQA